VARTRSIKPGFFTNEILGSLPYQDRLLFAGLWCLADREGRLEDRPARIRAELFPYDHEIDVEASLLRLVQYRFINRYITVNPPLKCIEVNNFKKHQSPHHTEKASVIPSPLIHRYDTVNIPPSTLPPLLPSTLPPERESPPNGKSESKLHSRYQELLEQFPYATGADEGCRQWISLVEIGEITESNVDQIFQGLERWKASRQWSNGMRQSIPNWLRDRRWLDKPQPKAKDGLDD
jgi:hypothetical protein